MQMQKVARKTSDLLNHITSGEAAFEAVLLSKSPTTAAYDQFWRITLSPPEQQNLLQSDISAWR